MKHGEVCCCVYYCDVVARGRMHNTQPLICECQPHLYMVQSTLTKQTLRTVSCQCEHYTVVDAEIFSL